MQDSSTLEPAGNSSVQVQVDMARGESFDDRPISWDEPVKIVWSLGTFAHKVSVKVTKRWTQAELQVFLSANIMCPELKRSVLTNV